MPYTIDRKIKQRIYILQEGTLAIRIATKICDTES